MTRSRLKGALRRYYEESLRYADNREGDATFLGLVMSVGLDLFLLLMWLFVGALTLPLFLPPLLAILSLTRGDATQFVIFGIVVGACVLGAWGAIDGFLWRAVGVTWLVGIPLWITAIVVG